jgi:hypothetical protein
LQALAERPWRGIVTTAQTRCGRPRWRATPSWRSAWSSPPTQPRWKKAAVAFLIQIFGRADVPASLCLAPRRNRPQDRRHRRRQLPSSLHKKWSFVFVGFAPGDPDLAMLAGRILGASPSTLEHFFVAPALSDLDARRIKAEFGLVPVSIEGKPGGCVQGADPRLRPGQ